MRLDASLSAAILGALLLQAPAAAGAPDAPPARVPRTGQTSCYGPRGNGVVACAGTGQDGEALAGVAWPAPRFAPGGEGTILDGLTGLEWTADADALGGPRGWASALAAVRELNRAGHLGRRDWRLPNAGELGSLVSAGGSLPAWLRLQGFRNVREDYYWTSTTYAAHPAHAWGVGMHRGILAGRGKGEDCFVWPVRDGGAGVVALPRTGEDQCRDGAGAPVDCAGTGQDGEARAGAAWPVPRFPPAGAGTVEDRLTGLVWPVDAPSSVAGCGRGGERNFAAALALVRCLNAGAWLGATDWRLPSRGELASLVHRGEADSSAWLAAEGFRGVRPATYWSSTTYDAATWNAWGVNLHDGAVTTRAKARPAGVWPVRGGGP